MILNVMEMLTLSFKTSKEPSRVLTEAENFFRDRGLRVAEIGSCCMLLEGGGGYVRIDIHDNREREVILETREWESPVKEFV